MGVYHAGELAAQAKAGVSAEAARVGAIVRTSVPAAAAAFLAERPMIVVGAADEDGRMWASLLTGPPGFLRAESGRDVLDIAAEPLPGDPLAGVLHRGGRVGAIAVDPGTRRRMRINGVAEPGPHGVRIVADQVYSNCPKYIQRRDLLAVREERQAEVTVSSTLDSAASVLVGSADTFFLATSSGSGDCDASHRGGGPGFVRVHDERTLSWPDYPGNTMMMTLGNLEQNRRAGLLFVGWSSGTTVQLTGTAAVDWTGPARETRFTVEQVRRTIGASPLRWGEPELSRFNPAVA
ncbi:pyridoxamine 5'-phosphate oxidase family protein [Amycolatopsis sp. NBC_00345]|uniref:pyridoxamine 5'-phosphate oxidase family protein n=1 Tax=Amycolatopsis sp. NBC_00345 TaxID=2975955 RepID=UPI002E26AD9A